MRNFVLPLFLIGLVVGLAARAQSPDGQFSDEAQEPASPQIIFSPGVNDAPVLDTSKSSWLTPQGTNDPAPSGAVGTLVSQLADFASPNGQVDNVTDGDSIDGDPAPVTGVAVTAADATNGTWYYSINNGALWSLLGTPSNGSARLLAADGNCRLYFKPLAGFSGVVSPAITFRAWDRTTGAIGGTASTAANGGATAYSTATDTASLSVGVFFRGVSTDLDAGGAASATLTLGQPVGTAVNDVMFAAIAVRPETAMLIPPAGWTLLRRVDNPSATAHSLAAYYRVAGVAEPASYDWTAQVTAGTVTGAVGGLQSWSGISGVAPVDVSAGASTPTGLSHTAPSVTATVGNTVLFTGFAFGSSATWTPPATSPVTFEMFDVMSLAATGAAGISLTGDVQTLAAAGATGTRTAAASNDADPGATMSFVVRPVTNTAPVLDAGKSPALAAVNEDAGAPGGAVGTLVSSLVDFAVPAGQVDNVTDPDAGALLGIALTATDTANGAWFYSTNGGGLWLPVGAVSHTTALALAADASTRLYFQPNANFNGALPAALTFRAWDRTSDRSGARATVAENGGRTAFSTETDTISLVVNGVNDPPAASNLSAAESYAENTPLNLIDIVVSDIDSATVTATLTLSSPAAGSLSTGTSGAVTSTYSAGTGVWSASGPIANVNTLLAGEIYTPAAGYYANFTLFTSVADGVAAPVTGGKAMTGIHVAAGRVPDGTTGSPLRVAVNPGDNSKLDLTWAASCGSGGADFAVYQGTIGGWYSHAPLLCSTSGALTATVTPTAGNLYYLIVPLSATREGSYGTDSAGAEIPPPASGACRPVQDLPSCS